VIDIRLSNDPRYWIERAEKARLVAEKMTDPVLQKMMLDVADGYERSARFIPRACFRTLVENSSWRDGR
jgi:hypothetical protein